MKVPPPELKELDASWSPWKFQVQHYGEAKRYGYPNEDRIIVTGWSNHETREQAEKSLKSMTEIHNRFHKEGKDMTDLGNLSKKTNDAIRRYGDKTCAYAYHLNRVEGEGATMIVIKTGLHHNQVSAAIAAGAEMAKAGLSWKKEDKEGAA